MYLGNPNLKQEVWAWLGAQLEGAGRGLPKDELAACLPALYASVEDRAAEVRKPAQEVGAPGHLVD